MQKTRPEYYFRKIISTAILIVLIAGTTLFAMVRASNNASENHTECVILLHGLCRSSLSMNSIKNHLKQNGYDVFNIDYASTRKPIEALADEEVAKAVEQCKNMGYERIHFVTHSLGSIIVRTYLQNHSLPPGSRIVMLAPPNQGSELADLAQQTYPRLSRFAGPAFEELGTGSETLLPKLSPIEYEVGIIIGNKSWNPVFSKILPGNDDGKVSVERAKLQEMKAFLVAPCNHTTILLNAGVQQQISHFLENGGFDEIEKKLESNPEEHEDHEG